MTTINDAFLEAAELLLYHNDLTTTKLERRLEEIGYTLSQAEVVIRKLWKLHEVLDDL